MPLKGKYTPFPRACKAALRAKTRPMSGLSVRSTTGAVVVGWCKGYGVSDLIEGYGVSDLIEMNCDIF